MGLLTVVDGKPVSVMGLTVVDGRITTMYILSDPQRLARLDLTAVENWTHGSDGL